MVATLASGTFTPTSDSYGTGSQIEIPLANITKAFILDTTLPNGTIGNVIFSNLTYNVETFRVQLPTATNTVEFNNARITASAELTVNIGKNIIVNNGSNIVATDSANLEFKANANVEVPYTSGNFKGIEINGNSTVIEATGTGNVDLNGRGGDDSNGFQLGIYISSSAKVKSNSGQVNIDGTGGASNGNSNFGVLISTSTQVTSSGAQITSSGGDVNVTGTGGGTGQSEWNAGVLITGAGTVVTAGTTGNVTVTGTGGVSNGINNGVQIQLGAQITSSGGDVNVTGTGGGKDGTGDNIGVLITGAGTVVTAGATGIVTVTGTGGVSNGINNGVQIQLGAQITSSGGDVNVTGTGGGKDGTGDNIGVLITGAGTVVTAGTTGNVTVTGTGGMSNGINRGVQIQLEAQITSSGGNVIVTGRGGGKDGTGDNIGVVVTRNGSMITAGATDDVSGTVTVSGTGGINISNNNHGIRVDSNSKITSSGGAVKVTGRGGGADTSDKNYGIFIYNGGKVEAIGTARLDIEGIAGEGNLSYGIYLGKTDTKGDIISDQGDILINGQSQDLNIPDIVQSYGSQLKTNGGEIRIIAMTGGWQPSSVGTDVETGTGSSGVTFVSICKPAKLNLVLNRQTVDEEYTQLKVNGKIDLSNAILQLQGQIDPNLIPSKVVLVQSTTLSGEFINHHNGSKVWVNDVAFIIRYMYDAGQVVLVKAPESEPEPKPEPRTHIYIVALNKNCVRECQF